MLACVRGCLLGGAVGDALGAPVEFMALADIRRRFGTAGITDYVDAYGRIGAITDDTQMTLFTAEGLVRAYVRACLKGICAPEAIVQHAYLRWLLTQGVNPIAEIATSAATTWPDGWLVNEHRLWARRAPGNTCLAALSATVKLGERAQNDSKGAGAIMRIAPIGLIASARGEEGGLPRAFDLGMETARLTHGHIAGFMSAGAFALLIALLMEGLELRPAVDEMHRVLANAGGSGFVTRTLDRALDLVAEGGEPSAEKVETLGGGWVGEEALAIAVYCALSAKDFESGLLLAVNHGGDSDTTASLVGQMLGTASGAEVIPARWLADLELRGAIERMATDLVAVRNETLAAEEAWSRCPGW